VRIEATNINSSPLGSQVPAQVDKNRQTQAAQPGVQVVASHQKYLQAANSAPDINAESVAEAKRLLQSGKLDNPESWLKAAQAIVDLGI
jgi:arginine utilization protein RocB